MPETPRTIESTVWNDVKKCWDIFTVSVDEYHGFTECRHCQKPVSHNIKSEGKFKVVWVRCACTRQ